MASAIRRGLAQAQGESGAAGPSISQQTTGTGPGSRPSQEPPRRQDPAAPVRLHTADTHSKLYRDLLYLLVIDYVKEAAARKRKLDRFDWRMLTAVAKVVVPIPAD